MCDWNKEVCMQKSKSLLNSRWLVFGSLISFISVFTMAACTSGDGSASNVADSSNRINPFRPSIAEAFNRLADEFDKAIANGDTVILENIEDDTSGDVITRQDGGLFLPGQESVLIFPGKYECLPGQGQWEVIEGSNNIEVETNPQTCQALVRVKAGAMPDSEGYFGMIRYSGKVLFEGEVRDIVYEVLIGDQRELTGFAGSGNVGGNDLNFITDLSDGGTNWNMAAGTITVVSTFEQDQDILVPVNAILMPTEFLDFLESNQQIQDPDPDNEGWEYIINSEIQRRCGIVHASNFSDEPIDDDPETGYLRFELPTAQQAAQDPGYAEGDPTCPFEHLDADLKNDTVNRDWGELDFRVRTTPLYEGSDRLTIAGLKTYGFQTGAANQIYYEYGIRMINPSTSEEKVFWHTYYFTINALPQFEPEGLPPYEYIGKHPTTGHDYFLITQRLRQDQAAQKADLFQQFTLSEDAYLVNFDMAELTWLKNQAKTPHTRLWVGYNDRTNEGIYVQDKDGQGFGKSHYDFWSGREPNNDGNEDNIHMNYDGSGRCNDTESYKMYMSVIEVEGANATDNGDGPIDTL